MGSQSPLGGVDLGAPVRDVLDHVRDLDRRQRMHLPFLLVVALVIGAGYVRWVIGERVADPTDVSWLANDPAQTFMSWAFLRAEPEWHFPPTYVRRLGYPVGISTSLMDPVPLLALPLRLMGRWLPDPFQYFGLMTMAFGTLQMLFGMLIARRWYEDRPRALVLAGVVILLTPAFVFRLHGHFALTAQWTLLAAFLIYLGVGDRGRERRLAAWGLLLVWCTGGINVYLTAMVSTVLIAAVASAALIGVVRWSRALLLVVVGLVVGLASVGVHGFLGTRFEGLVGAGFGTYSFNLRGLVNPQGTQALVLPPLPQFDGQGEGFSYLGLGVLLLLLWAVPAVLGGTARVSWRRWAPITVASLLLALFAASNRITFGATVLLDVPLPAWAQAFGGTFRASGRFAWPLVYLLTVGALWAVSRLAPRSVALPLLAIAVALQLVDTAGLRQVVQRILLPPDPPILAGPAWTSLRAAHDHLVVLPAWQCSVGADTPGGVSGQALFGRVAWSNGLTLNSFYPSRVQSEMRRVQCDELPREFLAAGIVPRTAYVLTDVWARSLAQQPVGDWRCERADGFVVCRHAVDVRGFAPDLGRELFAEVAPGAQLPGADARLAAGGWDRDAQGTAIGRRWAGYAFRVAGAVPQPLEAVLTVVADRPAELRVRAAVDGVAGGTVERRVEAGRSELRLPLGSVPPSAVVGIGVRRIRSGRATVRVPDLRVVPLA